MSLSRVPAASLSGLIPGANLDQINGIHANGAIPASYVPGFVYLDGTTTAASLPLSSAVPSFAKVTLQNTTPGAFINMTTASGDSVFWNGGPVTSFPLAYLDVIELMQTPGFGWHVISKSRNRQAGAVLQVVQSVVTYPISFAVGALADAISVAITPSSASSKILVHWDTSWGRGDDDYGAFYLYRNGSKMYGATGDASYQDYQRATGAIMNRGAGQDRYVTQAISGKYLDSPASTSAQTYTIKGYCSYGSYIYLNRAEFVGDTGYQMRTFSTMTAMEIAG